MQSKEQRLKSNAFPDLNKILNQLRRLSQVSQWGKEEKEMSLRATEKERVGFHQIRRLGSESNRDPPPSHISAPREAAGGWGGVT